jgi:hypothetical protein
MLSFIITTLLLFLVLIIIYVISKPKPKFGKSLCLLAVAKNEEMVIDEWIRHYIWQGVDHFYIIDNGSTDNMKNVLTKYIKKGILSYFYNEERYQQVKLYNQIYKPYIKNKYDWLIICDVDEYIYYRGKKVLKDYINSLDQSKISNITLNWKMFGSNGHVTQPKSIRTSFVTRKEELHKNVKSIINISVTPNVDIHNHIHTSGKGINNPKELALNHYPLMSQEYYTKIKMTRGDSNNSAYNNARDWQYFLDNDNNELYDSELSDLINKINQ